MRSIAKLHNDGFPNREIARKLRIETKAVSNAIQTLRRRGDIPKFYPEERTSIYPLGSFRTEIQNMPDTFRTWLALNVPENQTPAEFIMEMAFETYERRIQHAEAA